MKEGCRICPRDCRVFREQGQIGYCGVDKELRIGKAYLHMWEEPCLSGTRGSGTIFFTGCSLGCIFCQNQKLARSQAGARITQERLCEICFELEEKGANNINLVTPTHYIEQLIPVLEKVKRQGLQIPIVYNTGSYDKAETIKRLEGLVDIYLPDMKYADTELSRCYSNAPDYFEVAKEAIREMVRQQPASCFEDSDNGKVEQGMMTKGVIVRHLVLPGCTKDSKAVLNYLYETYGNQIFYSIMNQYTPMGNMRPGYDKSRKITNLQRKVTKKEYDSVVDYAILLGIENGFIQEGECAKESFIPDFDLDGI